MDEGEEREASSWYDDAPITDEQLDVIRRDLAGSMPHAAQYSRTAMRKVMAEVERLRSLQDSYIVALDQVSIGDVQRLAADCDAATERAETAERALADLRERIGEHKPGSHCPVCGTPMCLDLNGLVPAHEHPTRGGYCSGTQRRPSEERVVGEWKAVDGG